MSLNLYENLNKFRQQNTCCDVVFEIGVYGFPAHRVVLLARMEYFRNILTNFHEDTTKKETFTFTLDPETIDSTYFSDFLNYVYTSEIDFTNENIRAIHTTAVYFQFEELIDKVNEHMKSHNILKVENVSYFRIIARLFGLETLGKVFGKVLFSVFQKLFWQSSENESSREELIPTSSLNFEKLKFSFEKLKENDKSEKMFHYSVDWILHDEVNRSGMLLELLKMIPLESLSSEFLKQVAYHYELIRKDDECLKLLFDAFITASKSDAREERRQRMNSLYAIGGLNRHFLTSVSRFHHSTRKWNPVTKMCYKTINFGCAVIGHKIYVCGGWNGKRSMNELTVFDTNSQRWSQLTPMKHARQLCAAAVLNGHIYVAGGCDDEGIQIAEVERYCVSTDRWENVSPLTIPRDALELVALNGFLYAIGGGDGTYALNSVERYDPQTDQWTVMNNTNYKYCSFGSAILYGNIYIAGDKKCEVYNPTFERWIEMPAPSECEGGRRLAAYNGKLYLIGGHVGEMSKREGIHSVEVFDMQTHVWRPEMNMDVARCFHGVAVVEGLFSVPIKVVFDGKESLNKLRLQNTGCDVIFKIGDRQFPAHRVVLLARMKYFWNEFIVHIEKEKQSVIPLEPEIIDSTFFDEVLNYIYTSKITFTTENIRPIYKTAEYFRFDELIYELEEHLEFTVNTDNFRSYLSFAIELSLKSLQRVFAQFVFQQILWDINKCSRKQLIPTLLFEDLKEILQKLEEDGSLEDMFHYTVDWIAHDQVNRSKMLFELLKNIPLHELSSDFVIDVVSQNGLVSKNIKCLNLLLDVVSTVPISYNESCKDVLYAIGGSDGEQLSSVSQYNSTTREWTATTPMPSLLSHFGCAVIGEKIYVCGGHNGERNINSLTVFDTLTQTWSQLTPMKHARQSSGVVVLNEQIYVAGGWDKTSALAVVERYNVQTDQWSDVASMTITLAGTELVALNGFLYAIGGFDGKDELNIVERYDPQTDQWTPMNNTNNKYSAFGSAVLNGNIYIVGADKCEVYNSTFKRWIEIPAPSECTYGRRLSVFNGKLYAIGGRVGDSDEFNGSKTVEVYDFEARAWKPDMDMDVARCFNGVAVVKN